MKNAFVFVALCFFLCSCTKEQDPTLVGKWKLTEELFDIGDGNGQFRPVDTEQFLEFKKDGTFTATASFCRLAADNGGMSTGTYSAEDSKLHPDNCADGDRSLTFEMTSEELVVNLLCIEPCKQKYVKMAD